MFSRSTDAVGTSSNKATYKPIVNNDQSNWLAGSSGSSGSSSKSKGRSGGGGGGGGASASADAGLVLSGGSNSSTTNSSSTTTTHEEGTTSYAGEVDANTQSQVNKYSGDYRESARVAQAYKYLQDVLGSKPGEFSSQYEDQLTDIYNRIMNREDFSYDMNSDLLYQQYKDQFTTQGKQAMEDTMGRAAAMTGGFGSTYTEPAGQQAYQEYLQQLNDKVPELYQLAYNRYKDEGEQMLQEYGLSKDMYDTDYQQYRDTVGDWQADRSFAQSAYSDERNFDWSQWAENRKFWYDEMWNQKKAVQKTVSDAVSNTNSTSTTVGSNLSWR